MKHDVITIGREYGSGGHEVGVRLAKRLGYAFYDKELLVLAAKKTGYHQEFLSDHDEKAPSLISLSATPGVGPSYYQQSPADRVFIEQSNIIRELAEKGPCVIVGRCADYVLQKQGSLNLFVHAPLAERIKRKVALGEQPTDAAGMEKRIRLVDRQRSKYYTFYTDKHWGDCRNYDLCINTGLVGIDGAVEVIMNYLHNRTARGLKPDHMEEK